MKTGCALPAVTVSSNANSDDYEVEYVEFGSGALNNSQYSVWGNTRTITNNDGVRNSPPVWDSPPRYTRFGAATGSATIYRQQIPTTTTATAVDGSISGRYVESIGGWKVYGMADQQAADY